LSEGDIRRINTKYNCYGGKSSLLSSIKHIRGKPSFEVFSYDEHVHEYDDDENEDGISDLFKVKRLKG
jgi:hypothetical protein